MSTDRDLLDFLRKENARLEERVAQLERVLGIEWMPPVEWRLTPSEGRIVGVLMAREYATRDMILAALYRDLGKDEPEVKIVDVFVCKTRKKLKPFGVDIITHWASGYSIPASSKAHINTMLEVRNG